MNATVTEIYKETAPLKHLVVEVEAYEWSAEYHATVYQIISTTRKASVDKPKTRESWLFEQDGIVITGRASIQRLAMAKFDKLMAQGPDEPEPLP